MKLTPEQRHKRQQDNEKKKEYLQSYKKYKQRAERLEKQLAEVRTGKMSPSLIQSDMPSAHNQKDLSDYIVQCDKIICGIIKARNAAAVRFSGVQQAIEQLEDENEKMVLTLRYLENCKWEQIACEVGVSWTHIHRIHSNALKNLIIPYENT